MINERIPFNFTEVWANILDLDRDGQLNDRELRLLALMYFGVPLLSDGK